MGGLIFGALLTLLLGPLSDRLGRRQFLIGYELSQITVALIALLTAQPVWLAAAAIVGGFGRGANGSPGPFAPVEQSWLMRGIEQQRSGMLFSLNTGMGFFGMAGGALLAGLPGWLSHGTPAAADFRVLFLIVLLGSLISLGLLLFTRDPAEDAPAEPPDAESAISQRLHENSLLRKLVGVNVLNGIGVGLVGPLLAYWFKLRFGVGPDTIAPTMALAFAVTGVAALVSGRLTRRLGVVRVVVWLRLIGLLLLLPMAFAPSFAWAGGLYVARSALSRGTIGARQALGVSLVGGRRRGLAASLNSVSQMLPFAVGPLIAGAFFQAGWLLAPFLMGAVLQGANLYLYRRLFTPYDPVNGRGSATRRADPHRRSQTRTK
jgi:MFS family permease